MKKKLSLLLILAWASAASAADWTPVQLEIGPNVAHLCDETTDVYGLRLAVVGKNRNVYGFDLSLDTALVDKDFGGIQVAVCSDVAEDACGLQFGALHARAHTSLDGLQVSAIWSETSTLHGGQIAAYNNADSGGGFQLGLYNNTEHAFSGLSLGAVSIAESAETAAQMGVLFNRVEKPSVGLQFGLVDLAEEYRGIQMGVVAWRGDGGGAQVGVYNNADNISGLQLGCASVAHSVHGLQINVFGSGAFEVRGLQTGLVNIAGRDGRLDGEVSGVEVGLINRVGTLSGVQLGALNDAQSCHGAQIGLVNRAGELRGFQIGILNLSGTGGLGVSSILNFAF